jgi:leucyl-tRNA synthetase
MILGEVEYTAFQYADPDGAFGWVSAEHAVEVDDDGDAAFQDARDGRALAATRVPDADVEKRGDGFVLRAHPAVRVTARAHKMSKSRGNVVNPDDIVAEFGADSLRLYEMFMGPLEQVKPWSTRSVDGVHRFLSRADRLIVRDDDTAEGDGVANGRRLSPSVADREPSRDELRALHTAIGRVTDDVEALRFNTAIAAMMEFVNAATKWETLPRAVAEPFVLLLAPFAPHLAEELWATLGHDASLAYEPWPVFDASLVAADTVEIAVQVNGKLRGTVELAPDASKDAMLEAARAEPNVARFLAEGTVRKEIAVPGRLVNFVVG